MDFVKKVFRSAHVYLLLISYASIGTAAPLNSANENLAPPFSFPAQTATSAYDGSRAAVRVGYFGVKVNGLNIIFPNTHYYQVQLSSNLKTVFEGFADPNVPVRVAPGTYHIINLSTRSRVDNVVIGTPATAVSTGPDTYSRSTGLSCDRTNATFLINYNNPVQYGKGPYVIRMKWINANGSFPRFTMRDKLTAVDSNGNPVGTMRSLGKVGNDWHPSHMYRWTIGTNGPTTPVRFIYGELNGGRQCALSGKSRLVSRFNNASASPPPPSASPPPPSAPVSTSRSEISSIELLQRSEGVRAFPGALGFGRNSVGGRSGRILTVNTVRNIVDPSDNFLSLREAIEVEKGPRTVVFSVGGVFDTGKKELNITGKGNNSGSYLTVACQSAPSPGVVMKTYGFNVQYGAHDLIFRHCAVRGIDSGSGATAGRGMTVRGGSKNIILDHMSFSWSTDEGFQVYVDAKQSVGTDNVTLSNSIIAEGDADSSHPESVEHATWGYHAMGPSCLSNNGRVQPKNCSIVNNYIAHNSSRNGMIWGGTGEISNNIIYNWFGIGVTAQPKSGSGVDAIINNNLMKSGPNTKGASSGPNCGADAYRCALYLKPTSGSAAARYSIGNNYFIPRNSAVSNAQLMRTHLNANSPAGYPRLQAATPSPESIVTMAAQGSRFMKCVGASRPTRDAIDSRVINEFHRGTGAIGIGDNVRLGGRHNVTKQRTFEIYGSPTSHPANHDKDKDGMADVWEMSYGLSDTDPNDHAGDKDRDGYTNIEEYLAIAALCQ